MGHNLVKEKIDQTATFLLSEINPPQIMTPADLLLNLLETVIVSAPGSLAQPLCPLKDLSFASIIHTSDEIKCADLP